MIGKLTLNNGVRLVYEQIPHVHSVAIGIWVATGSRRETPLNNGVSHFIEHMLFKGTKKRTAKEIAECFDNIGGQVNAFTGKECTCYYAKILDENLELAVDVLSDMFFNSTLVQQDIEVEKKVILEEIHMYEDSPEEVVHDLLSDVVWKGDALGYSILGTTKSVRNIERKDMIQYMESYYLPSDTVISVAGNFDILHLESLVKKYFEGWAAPSIELSPFDKAQFHVGKAIKWKDTEQVHLCLGLEGIEHGKDQMYSLLVINNIFGGGMSSRLFQKIREEQGLVYSIYAYPSSYKASGLFTIYAGMNPDHLSIVVDLIIKEIKSLRMNGLTEDDVVKSKNQLKGNYILGLESTTSRMNSIGKSELLLGKMVTQEEVLAKIDSVNQESIQEVIHHVFNFDMLATSLVGKINQDSNLV